MDEANGGTAEEKKQQWQEQINRLALLELTKRLSAVEVSVLDLMDTLKSFKLDIKKEFSKLKDQILSAIQADS